MTAPPFLSFAVRGKKDAIRVRQRARQIASLLRFPIHEQACIAAGAFLIACQAHDQVGRFVLCFQIDDNQLHIYARSASDASELPARINRVAAVSENVLQLLKPLPAEMHLAEADLAWMVRSMEETPTSLFEEIVKQNQEVLTLLHELQASWRQRVEEQPARPHAA